VSLELENADPTPNKQYVQWLVKAYINGSELEDLYSRGKDNLIKFELLKKKRLIKSEHADIGKLKNLSDFEDAVEQYEIPEEEFTDKGQSEVIEDNEEFKAIIPFDEKSACYYGQGTRWCTAAKNDNMFSHYDDMGDLIILIPKKPGYKGEKYQIHNNPFIIMNEKDKEVPKSLFEKRFKTLDWESLFDKTLYFEKAGKSRIEKNSMTPLKALSYARNIIKGRFLEGEKVIAKDIQAAYIYARYIMNGRFPEGEKVIAKDPKYALAYARYIMNGRFPEGEKAISSKPPMQLEYEAFLKALENEK